MPFDSRPLPWASPNSVVRSSSLALKSDSLRWHESSCSASGWTIQVLVEVWPQHHPLPPLSECRHGGQKRFTHLSAQGIVVVKQIEEKVIGMGRICAAACKASLGRPHNLIKVP
mmetsp:Transcript_37381/g.98884  ORF Transcript_37381/g.98884 Transcript_37381/m.98884 type:complete len:114 (-) Transcript_37381:524-865(-)